MATSGKPDPREIRCWCGNAALAPFSDTHLRCPRCETLVANAIPASDVEPVRDEDADLYGLNYFIEHARALGHPDLIERSRLDLSERCVFWLKTLLRHRPPPARTLELGSANGAFVALLTSAGYDAAGLDLSPAVTAYARDTFDVPVLTGPFEEQGLPTASLDVLVMMDVLEHLPDPLRVLGEAARVLKPDGLLFAQTPRFDPELSFADLQRIGAPFLAHMKPAEHLFLPSREAAKEMLERAGFGVVQFEPAIFSEYDMSFFASRTAIPTFAEDEWRKGLRRSRSARVVEALVDAFDAARSHEPALTDHAVLERELKRLRDTSPPGAIDPPPGVDEGVVARTIRALRTLGPREADAEFWKGRAEAAEKDRDTWIDHTRYWKPRAEAFEQEIRAWSWISAHPAVSRLPTPPPTAADLPLVTIVTPTLNQARTLRETIDSVAAQSYPRIEHIVVDGGSTDGTLEILQAAPGLRYVSEKDRGQADAINKGLRLAKGDIVAYLNSDDVLYPEAVSIAVEAFLTRPDVEFVYGDGTVVDADGNKLWEWLSRPEDWRLLGSYFFLWNDFTNYIMQPASFWRRRLHERVGLLDETFHFAMDVEFWLRVGRSGAQMLHVAQPLAKFRMAPGTKTLSSPTAFWEDHLELFRREHGLEGMRRYVEQYLFQEMLATGCSLEDARERYRAIVARRWGSLPERDALERLGATAGAGALVRRADHAWNGGDAAAARRLFGRALHERSSALVHGRSPVLLVKLVSGPFAPLARRLWKRSIEAYRNRRYQYRYRARRSRSESAAGG